MAEAIVSAVLGKLADFLINKAQDQLEDVREQIEQMQQELRLIHALLRDANSKRNTNELVTEWLNQVKEIGDKIDSVIDTFRVNIEQTGPESSNWLRKKMAAVKRSYKTYKHGMRKELEGITQNLNRILQRGIQLGIQDKLGALDDVDDLDPSDKLDDPEVVGLEDDKGKIIKQLLDSSISRRTVLSIVGTGGLGKTTLAKKVYKSAELERHFHCRAWLSISQKYDLNDLWREILYSIEPQMKNKNPPITDGDLVLKLKSSLRRKRYLIILDDIWDINLWEQLEKALPDENNESRVIITTRNLDVAKAADCNTDIHKIDYLNDAEGLALLFRRAFQRQIQSENYPGDLLEIAKRLTKKCGGLPLALVVLGGILTRRDRTYSAWSKVEETIDWSNEDGEKCMQILAKSYEDLPDHLKSCFLYFAAFPEDYRISGRHLTGMWMAEEFIPKGRCGTMEDRAEKCLEELVQRCLIQVTKKSWNGYCKYCSMHDLLRDLAIHKAKEENFFTVFSKAEENVNQLAARKPRRAALQFCTLTEDGVYSENTCSLLCFGEEVRGVRNNNGFRLFPVSKVCGFSKLNYSCFSLLRVLTLQNVDMTKFTPRQWPKGLIHLTYLGLRECRIPQDIFKKFTFNNLETIDFEKSRAINNADEDCVGETIDLSDAVIPTLRHVYGSGEFCLPLKWNLHPNLQTVKNVSINTECIADLKWCINLRTLGIEIGTRELLPWGQVAWQNLKDVLRSSEQLVYLSIKYPVHELRRTSVQMLPFGGTKDLPCHGKIQKLRLHGKWDRNTYVRSLEMFPTNLTKLTLAFSWLHVDPMPILERLQSLSILNLTFDSYVGTGMICLTGGFPKLKKLKLHRLSQLWHWDIIEGAMPILTHLEISDCKMLHAFPELQKVRTLQELLVKWPSHELRESMQGKDLHKIEHIPSVRIWPEKEEYMLN
ncbi:disease resistance protein RPP13-like [Carex rostrata]